MVRSHSSGYRLATVFGIGRVPFASGTVATLIAGVPCFLAVGSLSPPSQIYLALLLFALGVYVSDEAEREIGRTDPGEVVIDELCGYLVAMIGHPVTFPSILAGFFFFRLFDIWKPWPLRILESRLKGGLGIMADDVGAGIYANFAGLIVLRIFHLL